MNEAIQILKADLAADERTVDRLYDLLAGTWDRLDSSQDVIVAGYYLHNLYVAFEHIFESYPERDVGVYATAV